MSTLREQVDIAKTHLATLDHKTTTAKALRSLIDRCDETTPALGQMSLMSFGSNTTEKQAQQLRAINPTCQAWRILYQLFGHRHLSTLENQDPKPTSADDIKRQTSIQSDRNVIARRLGDLEAHGYAKGIPDACTSDAGISCKGYVITDAGVAHIQATRHLRSVA